MGVPAIARSWSLVAALDDGLAAVVASELVSRCCGKTENAQDADPSQKTQKYQEETLVPAKIFLQLLVLGLTDPEGGFKGIQL